MTNQQFASLPAILAEIVEIDRRIAEILASDVVPMVVHLTLDGLKTSRRHLTEAARRRWGHTLRSI